MSARIGRDKSRAALAKAASTQVLIEGEYEDDRTKFGNLSNALGAVYNGNVINNVQVLDDVDAAEVNIVDLQDRIAILEAWIIDTFPNHTHNYEDGTIADTDLGGSTEVETTKTTTGVN